MCACRRRRIDCIPTHRGPRQYKNGFSSHALKMAVERAGRLELELFSMLCSHEIFTDQSYHAWIRSEKNSSIRSDACMTADYARGQPASAWPLASKPCRVDCDLHTIARAHNNTFFVRPIGTLGHHQNLCQNGTFSSSSNWAALSIYRSS